jgi:class 3 adenylate cyclase/pimeloyl-ACP methyl ester carboxylesterase
MDTPPIQYVKTSDGVSIAYYAVGGGPSLPVVWMDLPSHLQLVPFPPYVPMFKAMSRLGLLVRYDHRGFGLSERSITRFPLDDLVKDLEAVVDRLALDTFILTTAGFAGLVPIVYAARHPERVAKLCISGLTHVKPAISQRYQALFSSGSDWRYVSEAISRIGLGWEDEEASRPLAAWYRESCDFDTFQAFWRDFENWGVRDLLPSVETPTLILAAPDAPLGGVAEARELASLLPNAQMAVGEGSTNSELRISVAQTAASFIYGPDALRPRRDARPAPSGMTAILFADIVDSTALTERLGDDAFRAKARELDGALRGVIREQGGRAIEGKLLGDGVLAVFTSARQAIQAALACAHSGGEAGLPLHLGLHAGDVIREEGNVYGGAVNIAARISGLSAPGEVLVSETVRSLARTSAGVRFEDRGEQELKGVGEAVRVWAVVEGE